MKHTRWWLIVAAASVLAACGGDNRQAGPVLADPAGVAYRVMTLWPTLPMAGL